MARHNHCLSGMSGRPHRIRWSIMFCACRGCRCLMSRVCSPVSRGITFLLRMCFLLSSLWHVWCADTVHVLLYREDRGGMMHRGIGSLYNSNRHSHKTTILFTKLSITQKTVTVTEHTSSHLHVSIYPIRVHI